MSVYSFMRSFAEKGGITLFFVFICFYGVRLVGDNVVWIKFYSLGRFGVRE